MAHERIAVLAPVAWRTPPRQYGAWETVAEFKDYPATTAKNPEEMEGSESVVCTLAEPLKVWAVRVIGKPACGDNPQQAFSSCAELQAFSE